MEYFGSILTLFRVWEIPGLSFAQEPADLNLKFSCFSQPRQVNNEMF
jgi:hypothetical protein